jgi:NADPH:quinone reductase-like Zn-dependent oxidoreductase
VLIWGIGGGVATAALAIVKTLGARAVVTSSSDEKLARAVELGADATVNHATEDVASRVKALTDGGAHVVVETVGADTWATSLAVARPTGRICVCGATSGPNPPANLHRIWWKQLTVHGSMMGARADFEAVLDLVVSRQVKPVIDSVFPLSEAREAHERLASGMQLGKVVLTIP